MGIDIGKYYKLDKQEMDSIVQIKARIFIGNNLLFYVIVTKSWSGYILCEDYDKLCAKFKVSIEDKSSIKRISFKTPNNFDINYFKFDTYTFEPTDTSKVDAYELFPNGKFIYRRKIAVSIENELQKILKNYCNTKYAEEIKKEKQDIAIKEANKFLNKLQTMPFTEVYDTCLKEVVGCVCLDKSTLLPSLGVDISYTAQVCLSISDVNRLGYKLNIVNRVEAAPSLTFKVLKTGSLIIRNYGQVLYNNECIKLRFNQNRDGVCSNVYKYAVILGIGDNSLLEYKNSNELRAEMERLRLSGNKWFSNNGKSFIKESKESKNSVQKQVDNRPTNKFGLIDILGKYM